MTARPITLAALWGNSDAESEIRISRREWNRICRGEALERSTRGYYEGTEFRVYWSIRDRKVSVTSGDGGDCLTGGLEELFIRDEVADEQITPPTLDLAPEPAPCPSDIFKGPSVRRRYREQVGAIIEKAATNSERRIHGTMVSSHESITWTIPGGTATWTQGHWGSQSTLYVEDLEARALILLEMGIDLSRSRTYRGHAKHSSKPGG